MAIQILKSAEALQNQQTYDQMAKGITATVQKERLHTVYEIDNVVKLRREGKYDEALNEVSQFVENETDLYKRGWALLEKGLLLELKGKVPEAIKTQDSIIQQESDPSTRADKSGILLHSSLYEKSKALSKNGETEKAIQTLDEAVSQIANITFHHFDPEFRTAQVSIRKGRYLRLLNHLNDSENHLLKIIDDLKKMIAPDTNDEKKRLVYVEISVAYTELKYTYQEIEKQV